MKSYLEGCGVPTAPIGAVQVPRLIMGIHPYDGCSYQHPERDAENFTRFSRVDRVTEVLRCAVEEAGITAAQIDHMLPELDRLHLQAVWETQQQLQQQIGLVAYIFIPINLDGEQVSYSPRAHATLYAHGERMAGQAFRDKMASDAIIRYNIGGDPNNLVTPATVAPYTEEEAARFEIDYPVLEAFQLFRRLRYSRSRPGAEIDLLAATGRFDLIRDYVACEAVLRPSSPACTTPADHPRPQRKTFPSTAI